MVRFFVSAVFDFFLFSLLHFAEKSAGWYNCIFLQLLKNSVCIEDKKRRIRRAEFTMITSMLASRALFGEPMVINWKSRTRHHHHQQKRKDSCNNNAAVGDTNDENSVSSSSSSSSSSSKSSKSGKKANHSDDIVYSSGSNNNNNDPVSIYNEDEGRGKVVRGSRNFVEVEYTDPRHPHLRRPRKERWTRCWETLSLFFPAIDCARWLTSFWNVFETRETKVGEEMFSMEEKDLNQLPVNQRRVEIEQRVEMGWNSCAKTEQGEKL